MTPRTARRTGAILQGLVLGMALFLALIQLLCTAGGVTVFRYQGF